MHLLNAIPRIRGLVGSALSPAVAAIRRPRLRLRQVPSPPARSWHHAEDRPQGHPPTDPALGKTRWFVERTFAWLLQFKRLRTRYETRADLHLGLLQLVCTIICLRRLPTSF